ncbi:hypothetical protein [Neisseria sp. Ec49-e6-T10]|uniref:hypothetical protein n=1 Tax=Neisseria sp. Ec49-e6-T10 TaxID=3140744 RepID=UPI003EC148A6
MNKIIFKITVVGFVAVVGWVGVYYVVPYLKDAYQTYADAEKPKTLTSLNQSKQNQYVAINLKNGTQLIGIIVASDQKKYGILTDDNEVVFVAKKEIVTIEQTSQVKKITQEVKNIFIPES